MPSRPLSAMSHNLRLQRKYADDTFAELTKTYPRANRELLRDYVERQRALVFGGDASYQEATLAPRRNA